MWRLSAFDCLRMRPVGEPLHAGWTEGAPVDVGNWTRIRCMRLMAASISKKWVGWTRSSPVTLVRIMRDVLYVVNGETAIDKHEPDQRADPYRSPNSQNGNCIYILDK